MARIPDSFIKELKERTDLVRFVKQYTQLKQVGRGVWQGRCPHPKHNDESPSFTVWQKEKSWACFGCHSGKKGVEGNKGSDIFAFIQWLKNVSFREAVEIVAEWNGVNIPTDENQKLYDQNYKLAMKYKKDLLTKEDHVIEYLYERGLDDIDIEKWMIGYDNFTDRIVFPLFDRYNNIIAFNKRTLDNTSKNKYKNSSASKIFNKSLYLYGINDLDDDYNEILITEGSMDVVLGRKYGLRNLVASLGTSFTEQHANLIYKLGKTPVLVFDGDEAGNLGLKKALTYFEALGVYCKIIKLPKNKDLADMCCEKKNDIYDYIRKKSITAGYFKIKEIIDEYNSNLYELRLETIPKIEEVMHLIPLTEKKAIKSFIQDEININISS